MKALIVDDVEMNRELLGMFLAGHATVTAYAASGEEALLLVKKAMDDNEHFDLICMDISMPGISGHAALAKIRELENDHQSTRATAFMITSSSSPDDMFEALMNGGCDDYLTKPLMQQSFNELLKKHNLL